MEKAIILFKPVRSLRHYLVVNQQVLNSLLSKMHVTYKYISDPSLHVSCFFLHLMLFFMFFKSLK